MAINTYLSIIILDVNGLNALITRHKMAKWRRKQDLYVCCLQETHFSYKDTQTERGDRKRHSMEKENLG